MYEVIYDYNPQNKGDITLHVGDRMQRVKDVGCGWVIGHNITTGETGHFPADYVQSMTRWSRKRSQIQSSLTKKNNYSVTRGKKSINPDGFQNKKISVTDFHTIIDDRPTNNETNENLPTLNTSTSNKIETVFKKPNTEPLKRWGKKLLSTPQGKHRRLKAVFGVIAGLVLGGAIFLALFYSFQYSLVTASIISSISTLLLCLGLAVSSRCRCIILLVFPSLATGKGRAAFLSIITGMLLMGPVTNITRNSNQVAVSMACITELAFNQSQALQDKLQEPVQAIRDQVKRGVEKANQFGKDVDKAFDSVISAVSSAENALKRALEAVDGFKDTCTESVNGGFSDCQATSKDLQTECMKIVDPINLDSNVDADSITTSIKSFVDDVVSSIGKKRRRRRSSCGSTGCQPLKRSKRSVLGGLCDIFSVGDSICGGFKSLDVCNIVKLPETILDLSFKGIKSLVNTYKSLFAVGVNNSGLTDGNANSSQTAAQIVNNIKSDLKAQIDSATSVITVLNRIMSVSIVLLILNAVLYERRFTSKLSFDNFYITTYFKEMDQKRKKEGKMSILPLKKKERKIYTDSRSVKMSATERGKCKMGLTQVLLHAVICIMLILFDYLLYFILSLLNKHGNVKLVFTGQSSLDIEITGNGIIASLFKALTNDISVSEGYNSTVDIEVCLPKPQDPNTSQIYIFVVLYIFALLFVLMQGYGQRLLHFIAAFFYPEKETQRVNYLYRKILVKRKSFIQEAKQLIMSNAINANNEDGTTSGNCLTRCLEKVPCCKKFVQKNRTCTNCEETVVDISVCQNKNCAAVFCEECFVELDKCCPLCAVTDNDDVDEVIALDDNYDCLPLKTSSA